MAHEYAVEGMQPEGETLLNAALNRLAEQCIAIEEEVGWAESRLQAILTPETAIAIGINVTTTVQEDPSLPRSPAVTRVEDYIVIIARARKKLEEIMYRLEV